MNALLQTLRNLGPVRLAALGGVALGLVAFFIYLTARLGGQDLALLYSDLETAESGRIIARLEQQGVKYQLKSGGTQIMVPSDQVGRLRVQLAEAGMPAGGGVGYEIFDKSDGLGTSNFVQNINQVRALEGELARTISSINRVRSARVHIVLPRREVFSREKQQPSASVVLKMKGGGRLEKQSVQAIQHLVAAAVPDLDAARITVIDDRGTLLARGAGKDEAGQQAAMNAEEMRLAYESRISRGVEQLLENTVGLGKARVEVNVALDFNRVTENIEDFDPDRQVVRSTQTVEEKNASNEADSARTVSVQNNLPETDGQRAAGGSASATNSSTRTEETVNYEIKRIIKTNVRETGLVQKVSIAVLVDGTYMLDNDGKRVYQPRTAQQLEQLNTLVKSAIGYSADRGDTVEVINMQFAPLVDPLSEDTGATLLGLTKQDFLQLAEVLVLGVVGLLVLLLVVRPVLARLFESVPGGAAALLSGSGAMLPGQQGQPAIAGPADVDFGPVTAPTEEVEEALDSMIDISRVEGRVRASSLRKIGEIVDKHPEEAVAIIRNWMYQEV